MTVENAMKGYWIILGAEVKNAQAQAEYARLWKPIGEHYGAVIKVLDGSALKELTHASRALVVEFSSYEQARVCIAGPGLLCRPGLYRSEGTCPSRGRSSVDHHRRGACLITQA